MSLRLQILAALLVAAVVPLAGAIFLVGAGFDEDFSARDTRRVEERLDAVLRDLERQDAHLARQLDALADVIAADNRFRLAVLADDPDLRAYLRDYASERLALMDLDMLQILDPAGTVVSSGHFPDAHGAPQPRLAELLGRAAEGRALLGVRTATGTFLALARAATLPLGGETWRLVGGVRLDRAQLEAVAGDPDLQVQLAWPGGDHAALADPEAIMVHEQRLHRAGHIVRTRHLPFIQDDRLTDAWLVVSHDRGALRALLAEVRRRLGLLLAVAVGLALPLAALLAGRVSRPLRTLAARTRALDLERLDTPFASDRGDEVGQLERVLGDLTGRLRRGVASLREAERRATLGEVARQVNHDIRNGITPLRHALRHLGQVAEDDPAALAGVFRARRANLDQGLAYLEELAGHYARLSPGRDARPCDLGALAAAVAAQAAVPDGAVVAWTGPPDLPPVAADPVSLRRVVENLVRNAVESLGPGGGRVELRARPERDPDTGDAQVLLEVADDGTGIAPEDLDRVFNDFFTTKPQGTGLGLSNVRRLVGDLGGSVRVASEPGRGTTFTVALPVAAAQQGAP